jgi:hypothetical protein
MVRRIEVTFGGRRHKSRWNVKVFKSNNCLILQRKKEKKKRKKRREKTYNGGYIVNTN